MYKIAVMRGDGIGPEIVNASISVLKAVEEMLGVSLFKLINLPIGLEAFKQEGSTFPNKTKDTMKACHGGILGPVSTYTYNPNEQMSNPSADIRKGFDLYANLRPIRSIPGVSTKFPNIDLMIVRENTEGMYADRNVYRGTGEWMTDENTALSLRVITRTSSERIAEMAFQMAKARQTTKPIAIVHKANVLRQGCGLFLEACKKISQRHEGILIDDYLVDAFAMYLVLHPETFDVIVTTNMMGDILSDEAAGLVGGLGVAPSLNVGNHFAVAQAAHGSAPTIAGKNVANPIAQIQSVNMLLNWLGKKYHDERLIKGSKLMDQSVWGVLKRGDVLTPDLSGTASTETVCHSIIEQMKKVSK